MSSRRRRAVRDDEESSEEEDPGSVVSESEDENSIPETPVVVNGKPANVSEPTDPVVQHVVEPKWEPQDAEEKSHRGRGRRGKRDPDEETPKNIKERKNPAFVPRGGQFFLHDNRQHSYSSNKDENDRKPGRGVEARGRSDGGESAWKHDKFDTEETVDHDRAPKKNKSRSRRNKHQEGEGVGADDKPRGPPAYPSDAPRPQREGGVRVGSGPNHKKGKQQKTQLQQRKPAEAVSVATDAAAEPAPTGQQDRLSPPTAALKASAAEFNPSLGASYSPVYGAGGPAPDSASRSFSPSQQQAYYPTAGEGAEAARMYNPYAGNEANLNAAQFAAEGKGKGHRSGKSKKYNRNVDHAMYPAGEYDASYGYDVSMGAEGYFPSGYPTYPANSSGMGTMDASGAVVYSVGTPGGRTQDGTVWFPTTPGGGADPAMYNGMQYYPTSPAPVYFDQSHSMGADGNGGHKKNYKNRSYRQHS